MSRPTSTDSSGGSELNALSNKARIFWSSFKRVKKSAYLKHRENILSIQSLFFGRKIIIGKRNEKSATSERIIYPPKHKVKNN